jgi:hypothetical protein
MFYFCVFFVFIPKKNKIKKSQRRDSNPRPADYKSAALPTELLWLFNSFYTLDNQVKILVFQRFSFDFQSVLMSFLSKAMQRYGEFLDCASFFVFFFQKNITFFSR